MSATILLLVGLVVPAAVGVRALRAPTAVARRARRRHRSTLVAATVTATALVALARAVVPWGFSVPAYWYLMVAAWATATGGCAWALPQLPRTRASRAVAVPAWLVAGAVAATAAVATVGPLVVTG